MRRCDALATVNNVMSSDYVVIAASVIGTKYR